MAQTKIAETDDYSFRGQWEQDRILCEEVFKFKKYGTFIEIGCADPVHLSNSFYFESKLNWRGIAVDARLEAIQKFRQTRSSMAINAAIGPKIGKSLFLDFGLLAGLAKYMSPHEYETIENYTIDHSKVNAYWVDVVPFSSIRDLIKIEVIDLLMLDVEGAEFSILSSIGSGIDNFRVLMVESNTITERNKIQDLLRENFKFYKRVGMDDIYINLNYSNELLI